MAERNKPGKGSFDHYPTWIRLVFFLALWFLISSTYMYFFADQRVEEIPYSDFKTAVKNDRISEVEIKGDRLTGRYGAPGQSLQDNDNALSVNKARAGGFKTVLPAIGDSQLLDLLEQHKVTIKAKPDEEPWLMRVLIILLPWILIIGFFILISKKMRQQVNGPGGPFAFGRSKAKRIRSEDVDVSFADVAGLDNAKDELLEMVDYLKNPDQFRKLGAQLPKGVLLAGPPGTGKTLMARAVAGEAGVPFYSISGSEFIEMFVGVGASRVRDMFSVAKKSAPSVIFIDELDSIGRVRGTGIGGGHDEREQTLNQILSEIDGFSPSESVIVLAATNRPDVLDPALIRPGRFDRQISLDLPQKEGRKKILQLHAEGTAIADSVNFEKLSSATIGFSGADLKNLVNEALLLAARKKKKAADMDDFNESRDKIIMGVKREDRLSDEEKKKVAYHEAGHALAALLLPETDPLAKVTIIPRGRSLGATEQVPEEDRHNVGKRYLHNRIAVMLAGRVAEELVFDEITSGAGDDLKKATDIARRMICQWGMSEKLGLAVFKKGEFHPFLGRELTQEKDYSEATAEQIDNEISRILQEGRDKARHVLEEHRDKLDVLAENLIKSETLSSQEISDLLDLSDTEQKI